MLDWKLGRLRMRYIYIAFIIFLLIANNAWAVAFSAIEITSTGVTFTHKGVETTVLYADIDAELVTPQNAIKVQNWLQDQIDVVIKRNTLPSDDPDRLADPALPWAFWTQGNNITYRNTLVTVFIENGLFNVQLESLN